MRKIVLSVRYVMMDHVQSGFFTHSMLRSLGSAPAEGAFAFFFLSLFVFAIWQEAAGNSRRPYVNGGGPWTVQEVWENKVGRRGQVGLQIVPMSPICISCPIFKVPT